MPPSPWKGTPASPGCPCSCQPGGWRAFQSFPRELFVQTICPSWALCGGRKTRPGMQIPPSPSSPRPARLLAGDGKMGSSGDAPAASHPGEGLVLGGFLSPPAHPAAAPYLCSQSRLEQPVRATLGCCAHPGRVLLPGNAAPFVNPSRCGSETSSFQRGTSDGFRGNLHFSDCAEKWCFQSENEMEPSLPPSPNEAAKWGLCLEMFGAHRLSSFCFFRSALLFFAPISRIFFMSRVHGQAALSTPCHLRRGWSAVVNPVILHFLGGKMCSEPKLSIEARYFLHKSGSVIDASLRLCLRASERGWLLLA